MNEREELAKAVFVADNYNATDDVTLSDWEALVESDGDASYAHRIAQGLIQAGYRRPRTITTVEEMESLPNGVVLRERLGLIWERQGDGEGGSFWVETGDEQEYRAAEIVRDMSFPATVLYEPGTHP